MGHAISLAAALLALALAAVSDLLLTRAQRDQPPDHPQRDQPPERPDRSHARPSRTWAASAAVTAACLVGVALGPPQALTPVSSQWEPTSGTPPEMPTQVSGEVAWSRTVSGVFDVVAGTTGPVVRSGSRVEAVDPHDGSTLWSYDHHGASSTGVGEDSDPRIIATPDRRHVLVSVSMPSPKGLTGRQVTVLDSTTGAVVAQREITFDFPAGVVQVTNSVALIGHEGVSLEDGSTLWALPRTVDQRFSGPAGSHTLILDQKCDRKEGTCTLTLADDHDPTSVRTLAGVVPDPYDSNIPGYGDDVVTIAQGWTVRRSDPAARSPLLEAVSLDAAGTASEERDVVPLGAYSGPDRATSSSRIALRPTDSAVSAGSGDPGSSGDSIGSGTGGSTAGTGAGSSASPSTPASPGPTSASPGPTSASPGPTSASPGPTSAPTQDPASQAAQDPSCPQAGSSLPPLPVAVFDPSTRSLTSVSVPDGWNTSCLRPSWPTPDTTVPLWTVPTRPDAPARLVLGRADGSSPVVIDTAESLLQRHDTAVLPFAVAAPGVVVVGIHVITDAEPVRMGATEDRSRTVLYGLQ